MKKNAYILFGLAVLLFGAMCAHVAYAFRDIVCGMQHLGYSAPPSVAFLYAIPYLVLIAAAMTVGAVFLKKASK